MNLYSARGQASRLPLVLLLCAFGAVNTACVATNPPPPDFEIVGSSLPAPKPSQGWRHLEAGSPEIATRLFQAILRDQPASAEARYGLGEALRRSGKLEDASAAYAQVVGDPQYGVRALEGEGLTLLQAGSLDAAKDSFTKTTTDHPEAWRAWLGLAKLRDRMRNWEGADDAYAAAHASTDQPHIVNNNQGVSFLARGAVNEAITLFESSLRYKPQFERARLNLELAQASLGRPPQFSVSDTDPKARARRLNNMGYIAMLQGNLEHAEALLTEALDTHPSYYASADQNLHILRALQANSGPASTVKTPTQ